MEHEALLKLAELHDTGGPVGVLPDTAVNQLDEIDALSALAQGYLAISAKLEAAEQLSEMRMGLVSMLQDAHDKLEAQLAAVTKEKDEARADFAGIISAELGRLGLLPDDDTDRRVQVEPRQVLVHVPVVTPVKATPRPAAASHGEVVAPLKSDGGFICKAWRGLTDPPQDCDWPLCVCDSHAEKVIAALQESGHLQSQKQATAALTVDEFRAEVKDKLGVVFNGCHSSPLARGIHRQQCEDFLVERYVEAVSVHGEVVTACPQWQPIETAPRDGTPFRAYAEDLIHEDFNPGGSVEAIFEGDGGFIGAVWDGQFDIWNTVSIVPTHWMPLPDPPVGQRVNGQDR